jgi:tetraacyldisaccharide 4'-kinase
MSLERFFKSFITSPLHRLAYPFSAIYYVILKVKKWRVSSRSASMKKPLVISIGNIDFGGSGKTPTLILFLELFHKLNCAVISRGYKSILESQGSTCVNNLTDKNAALIGDEPMLIFSKFPDVSLFVGKDKKSSLESCKNVKLVFLDDGAQSHSVKKDISIILLDPEKPVKPLFPAGYRRDLIDTLKQADFVMLPYCNCQKTYQEAKEITQKYTKAPICGLQAELQIEVKCKKIALLTTIAKPERLKKQLISLGYEIVFQKILDDHQLISKEVIADFEKKSAVYKAEALCVTEKDLVKIDESYKKKFSIISLKLIPAYDKEEWESFIGKIQKMS